LLKVDSDGLNFTFGEYHERNIVYLRLYEPETPAFDGSWIPGDFEAVS
jgi:hypothetical protein